MSIDLCLPFIFTYLILFLEYKNLVNHFPNILCFGNQMILIEFFLNILVVHLTLPSFLLLLVIVYLELVYMLHMNYYYYYDGRRGSFHRHRTRNRDALPLAACGLPRPTIDALGSRAWSCLGARGSGACVWGAQGAAARPPSSLRWRRSRVTRWRLYRCTLT